MFNDVGPAGTWQVGVSPWYQTVTQTFTVHTGFTIDTIQLGYGNSQGTGLPLDIRLYATDGIGTSSLPSAVGADLISLALSTPANMIAGEYPDSVLEIDLTGPDEVFLAAGTYALELDSSTYPFNWIRTNTVDVYTDGIAYYNNSADPLRDMSLAFTGAPVPEPSTAVLLTVGLLGLGARTRCRRR